MNFQKTKAKSCTLLIFILCIVDPTSASKVWNYFFDGKQTANDVQMNDQIDDALPIEYYDAKSDSSDSFFLDKDNERFYSLDHNILDKDNERFYSLDHNILDKDIDRFYSAKDVVDSEEMDSNASTRAETEIRDCTCAADKYPQRSVAGNLMCQFGPNCAPFANDCLSNAQTCKKPSLEKTEHDAQVEVKKITEESSKADETLAENESSFPLYVATSSFALLTLMF